MNPMLDAFRLHDEQGFPLTAALAAGKQVGIHVNLAAFACDALRAGWQEDKVRRTLEEACADNGELFSWEAFRGKLALLWKVAGGQPDPECWQGMKHVIARAQP